MNPYLFRRIRGPVFLLCFALTAILAQYDILSFARSWPLYLIVAGLLRMLDALLPFAGPQFAGYNASLLPGGPVIRRSSVTFALAELVFGTVALLVTTDVVGVNDFWRIYAIWWPLLLIVLGLLLLAERVFDGMFARRLGNRYGPAGAYMVRRRRSGGLVFLVILLILLGMVNHRGPFSEHWRFDPDWDWSMHGETHENDVTLEQPIAADAALTIDNAHGDVQIAPSTDGMIHVDAHQTAHVQDRQKQHAFDAARPTLSVEGKRATLTVPRRDGVDVRLVLTLPESVLCTIRDHHGDITVSGLKKPLTINQDHGDVTLDSLGGAVQVTMDHGDVHARSLASDLLVDGHADDVTASDVQGKLQLQGEFFGSTELDHMKGVVSFHSGRTDMDVQHLGGALSLDSGDLKIEGANGLKVRTRSKGIELTELSGDAQVEDSNGDVSVALAKQFGALNVQNSTGDVTVSVPPGSGFSINGRTSDDNTISSEFPLTQTTAGGSRSLSGQIGSGGPHLEIVTSHGDLTLRRTSANDDVPEKPEAPEKPEKPEKPAHMRHLQAQGEPPAPAVQ